MSIDTKTVDEIHKNVINIFNNVGEYIDKKNYMVSLLRNKLDFIDDIITHGFVLNIQIKDKINSFNSEYDEFLNSNSIFFQYFHDIYDIYVTTNINKYHEESYPTIIPHASISISDHMYIISERYRTIMNLNNVLYEIHTVSDDTAQLDYIDKTVSFFNYTPTCDPTSSSDPSDILFKLNIDHKNKKKFSKKKKTHNSSDDNHFSSINLISSNDCKTKDDYMKTVCKSYLPKSSFIDKCSYCSSFKVINGDNIVCEGCGCIDDYNIVVDINKKIAKDRNGQICRQIKHFIEKMEQYQTNIVVKIPDEIVNDVEKEMKKYNRSPESLTIKQLKDILKKYGHNKYYKYIYNIFSQVTKNPAPIFDKDQQSILLDLFCKVEEVYPKYKPVNRTNFMTYSYVMNKLLLMMDLPEHASQFPLLKSSGKLKEQDVVWNKICDHWKWPFASSI